jgi:phenol 2-monooxygenase
MLNITVLCREHSFWNPGPNGTIERTGRAPDVTAPTARYQFEVTLHQGAIESMFLDAMSLRGLIVDRPTTVHDLKILSTSEAKDGYKIEVTLRHLEIAEDIDTAQPQSNITSSSATNDEKKYSRETIIYAKYVIGCDGAHSWVRKKLGITMDGGQTGKYLHCISNREFQSVSEKYLISEINQAIVFHRLTSLCPKRVKHDLLSETTLFIVFLV